MFEVKKKRHINYTLSTMDESGRVGKFRNA